MITVDVQELQWNSTTTGTQCRKLGTTIHLGTLQGPILREGKKPRSRTNEAEVVMEVGHCRRNPSIKPLAPQSTIVGQRSQMQ